MVEGSGGDDDASGGSYADFPNAAKAAVADSSSRGSGAEERTEMQAGLAWYDVPSTRLGAKEGELLAHLHSPAKMRQMEIVP